MRKIETFASVVPDAERDQKYKLKFLNSVLLLDGIVAFVMGFIRWQASAVVGMIDFGFAGLCLALLAYLYRHSSRVEQLSLIHI